jgi:hypothetical protein
VAKKRILNRLAPHLVVLLIAGAVVASLGYMAFNTDVTALGLAMCFAAITVGAILENIDSSNEKKL